MDNPTLPKHPLFLALTRTPMVMRVTQTFFILNALCAMILFLITKNIVLGLGLFSFIHFIGVMSCQQEERFFEILLGHLSLTCPNRTHWGCNSYDPQ